MQYRKLGRTGFKVFAICFGAWAIGGGWGSVGDRWTAQDRWPGIARQASWRAGCIHA